MTDAPALPTTDAEPARRHSLRALAPMLPYALRYRWRMAGAFLALTLASAATLTLPAAVRGMIDHGFSGDSSRIDKYFLAMGGVVFVLALASAARYYLVMTLGERVVADIRAALFERLASLDAAFFDRARIGELVSRLSADTTQLKSAFGASASVALRNFFMFVGAVALMVATNPKLSGLALVAIPLIVLPLVASGRGVRRRSRAAQDALADTTAYAAENLAAVRVMQAFGGEAAAARRFAKASEEAFEAARAATAARARLTFVVILFAFCSVVAVLWWGARDVLAGRASGGELSQFLIYAVLGASSLGGLSEVWTELSSAAGAAGRISELLAARPKIVELAAPIPPARPAQGAIRFDHLRFSYPAAAGAAVLRDFDASIAAGERVALVGASGAGKSTIFQLLLRFYDPAEGRILIDGIDIARMRLSELRALIALAPQDPTIFSGSIADNIAYGREGASREAVEAAARRAQADEFIRRLPDGYDSRVGERGVTLSGGQRQRLAIARAILKDAPILLLDEATSALDSQNEALVQDALEDVMRGRTTLVIAHRLATVLKADRILVLDGGRIVEQGRHEELVARGGLYADLARLQFGRKPALEPAPDER